MPQSLANVLVHIVFSTQDREPLLSSPSLQVAIHKYLAAASAELHYPVVTVGGAEDHVQILPRQARSPLLTKRVSINAVPPFDGLPMNLMRSGARAARV